MDSDDKAVMLAALADDVAAQIILSNPGSYFQTVSVILIEG